MADQMNAGKGKKKRHTGRNILIILIILAALFALYRYRGGGRPAATASTESSLSSSPLPKMLIIPWFVLSRILSGESSTTP